MLYRSERGEQFVLLSPPLLRKCHFYSHLRAVDVKSLVVERIFYGSNHHCLCKHLPPYVVGIFGHGVVGQGAWCDGYVDSCGYLVVTALTDVLYAIYEFACDTLSAEIFGHRDVECHRNGSLGGNEPSR